MQEVTLLPITAACLSCFCRHEVQSQLALNTSLLGVCPHQCQGTHCLFCSCRSAGRAEAFVLLEKLTAFSIPHLGGLYVSSCFFSLSFVALWSLQMEASLRPHCGLTVRESIQVSATRETTCGSGTKRVKARAVCWNL